METRGVIQRALISVSDKTGLLPFAQMLIASGVQILATGGTARFLTEHQCPVIQVSDYTGFPEIMDGRVKTLHPKIFSGLLHRSFDKTYLPNEPIQPIDLLVVNLYPFTQTVAKPDCTFAEAIENIDVGGPAMLRAAAKNHQTVAVVCDPQDYSLVLQAMQEHSGQLSETLRLHLATKVFAYTARYDQAIWAYLASLDKKSQTEFPDQLHFVFNKMQELRYGENPHQQAALYHFVEKASSSRDGGWQGGESRFSP